jgi:hypothetical protein
MKSGEIANTHTHMHTFSWVISAGLTLNIVVTKLIVNIVGYLAECG